METNEPTEATTGTSSKPFDAAAIMAEAERRGEDALATMVGQLAGYASSCWENLEGAGVFQSREAAAAVDSAVEVLKALAWHGGRTVWVQPGERLVLRLTTMEGAGLEELVANLSDRERVLVVAPEIEAFVLSEGVGVEVRSVATVVGDDDGDVVDAELVDVEDAEDAEGQG